MGEKVKNKDAEPAPAQQAPDNLDEGLEETFPASDPVSATREPEKPASGEKVR
jgi:hypothetical protein